MNQKALIGAFAFIASAGILAMLLSANFAFIKDSVRDPDQVHRIEGLKGGTGEGLRYVGYRVWAEPGDVVWFDYWGNWPARIPEGLVAFALEAGYEDGVATGTSAAAVIYRYANLPPGPFPPGPFIRPAPAVPAMPLPPAFPGYGDRPDACFVQSTIFGTTRPCVGQPLDIVFMDLSPAASGTPSQAQLALDDLRQNAGEWPVVRVVAARVGATAATWSAAEVSLATVMMLGCGIWFWKDRRSVQNLAPSSAASRLPSAEWDYRDHLVAVLVMGLLVGLATLLRVPSSSFLTDEGRLLYFLVSGAWVRLDGLMAVIHAAVGLVWLRYLVRIVREYRGNSPPQAEATRALRPPR